MKIIKFKENKNLLNAAAKAIKNGKVLVCPTDTVYGLLADASNKKAVENIFRIKNRPRSKPLGIFVRDLKMAKKFAFINKEQKKFLKKNWPGKLTAVLKGRNNLPKIMYAKNGTIGIRIPDYQLVWQLLKKNRGPLIQTSANISGRGATTKIQDVLNSFSGKEYQPDLILDAGNLPKSKQSKVVDLTGSRKKVLRY